MLANSSDTMSQEHKQRLLMHEVRNSIGVVLLNLYMVKKESTPSAQERLDVIRQELDAITAMLEIAMKK